MTHSRLWEVRLAHDDDTMIHVGSVYTPLNAPASVAKNLAVHKFGDAALAVRDHGDGRWDDIE
jgi:hypothetical protein